MELLLFIFSFLIFILLPKFDIVAKITQKTPFSITQNALKDVKG